MTKTKQQEWEQTDDLQWIMCKNEDVFQVIEVTLIPSGHYLLTDMEVDLSYYTDNELEEVVSGYYDNLTYVKEVYGNAWKQIVSEIIAEQNNEERLHFDDAAVLQVHLQKKYDQTFNILSHALD